MSPSQEVDFPAFGTVLTQWKRRDNGEKIDGFSNSLSINAKRPSLMGKVDKLEDLVFGRVKKGGVLPRLEAIEVQVLGQPTDVCAGIRNRVGHLESFLSETPNGGDATCNDALLEEAEEEIDVGDGERSDVTDPEMPDLETIEDAQVKPEVFGRCMDWAILQSIGSLCIERNSPDAADMSDEEAFAESLLQKAEVALTGRLPEVYPETTQEDERLQVVAWLHQAVAQGCRNTAEAAIETLLLLLRVEEGALIRPITKALAQYEEFPPQLAVTAARILMLRPTWPGRDDSTRILCMNVARSNPLPVVQACVELVPRLHAKDMLGFSWILEPLVDRLVPSFNVGDRVVVVCNTMSDSKDKLELKKGLEGTIGDIDGDGDMSIRFDGFEKKQWIFKRRARRLAHAGEDGDGLPCAVCLLCDDAGGPPLCASSGRAMLMKFWETVGSDGMARQARGEVLAKKARQVDVIDKLTKLKDYRDVSASE